MQTSRVTYAIVLLAAAVLTGGCSQVTQGLFGTQGQYLLYAYDVVTPPGRQVDLKARLQSGTYLGDQVGAPIRFYYQDRLFAEADTDSEGIAQVEFTPLEEGDYVFTVSYKPTTDEDDSDAAPVSTNLIVSSRRADTRFVVVDLDKTLVQSGFHLVLAGDPTPMPGSAEVMHRLAEDYSVIYLTHRPDYFGPKSGAWLRSKGYPQAPLLTGNIKGLIEGSGAFKGQTLQDLARTFSRLEIGIGDKISDVQAYVDNGMRGFLVIHPETSWDAEDYEDLASDLNSLPDSVQVVTHWRQIEEVLYGSADYSLPKVRDDLRSRARKLAESEREEDDD
ncbi:MAG: hypothetical protein ACLFUJ_12925, partial [Phycisphaerae bacterium]